jgi:hypothetical protein
MRMGYKYLVRGLIATILVAGAICMARADNDDVGLPGPQGPQGIQGPIGPQGPMGPIGPKGTTGTNGSNGVNGASGTNGTNGKNGAMGAPGTSANMSTDTSLGVGLRIMDEKYASVMLYDKYSLRDTHNSEIGAMIMFKIGTSYEEREINKLKKLLGAR